MSSSSSSGSSGVMLMKICFDNHFRRFQFPVNGEKPFDALYKLIEENYGLSSTLPSSPSWIIRYEDDDGDTCLISSNNEFKEYISYTVNAKKNYLKLFLEKNNNNNNNNTNNSEKKNGKKSLEKRQEEEEEDGVLVAPIPPVTVPATPIKADIKEEKSQEKKDVVHHQISCSECGISPIIGVRYKCSVCNNFNLCEKCEEKPSPSSSVNHDKNHTFLKMKTAENFQVTHHGVECDQCGQSPIVGLRYKCQTCLDYDMCESCEKSNKHPPSHSLLIFKQPSQSSIQQPSQPSQPSQLFTPVNSEAACGGCPITSLFRNLSSCINACDNKSNNNSNNDGNNDDCFRGFGRGRGRGFGRGRGRGKCRVVKKIFFFLGLIFVLKSLFCRNGHCCGVTLLLGAFIAFKIFKCFLRRNNYWGSCAFPCSPPQQYQRPQQQQQQQQPVEEKQEKYTGPYAAEIELIRPMGFNQPVEVLVGLFNTAAGLSHRGGDRQPFNNIQWVCNKLLKLNHKGEILDD